MLPPAVSAAAGPTPPSTTVDRIPGADRYETSVNISKKIPLGPHYVVLARGDVFADALASAPATNDATTDQITPVLLTPAGTLDARAKAEIDRRLDPGDTVLMMGGSVALAPGIDTALTAAGYKVQRLTSYLNTTGETVDRFDTAAAVAERVVGSANVKVPEIIVASGFKFPDALAASSYAAANAVPILLGTTGGMPAATQKFLNNHADATTTVHVVGGPAAVAQPTAPNGIKVVPHAGIDRYETATLVGRDMLNRKPETAQSFNDLVLARGDEAGGGADALSGGPLAGGLGAPLLLTDPNTLPGPLVSYIASLGYDRPLEPAESYLLGGTAAVTAPTAAAWSNLLNGLLPVPGRSSTYRDTVTGSSGTPANTAVAGCKGPQGQLSGMRSQTFALTAAGDLPGKLDVTAHFCADTPDPGPPPDLNPLPETETVLPGTAVVFTPTGGTAITGKVIGGFAGGDGGSPPGLNFSRRTSIDFVIDTANIVGHLNFVNNYSQGSGSAIDDGVLAAVGAATRQSFDGQFGGTMPAAGACKSDIGYNGALGALPLTITNMTWCKFPLSTTSELYHVSGGTVGGGAYTGQVVAGVRRGGDLGLQLRTDQGLIDIYAALDGSLHATGGSSPGMVQLKPETDPSITVVVAGGDPDAAAPGCNGTTSGRKAGRTFKSVDVSPPHFAGPLDIKNGVVECQTDTNIGVVEPTGDGGSGGTPCSPDPSAAGDPTANRVVLYTAEGGRPFRGRILSSTFTANEGGRAYGLTLLLEENINHVEECPLPGGPSAVVDDPGVSFTVVRVVVPGGAGAITFAR
jgi:putative cell wall-binding protein